MAIRFFLGINICDQRESVKGGRGPGIKGVHEPKPTPVTAHWVNGGGTRHAEGRGYPGSTSTRFTTTAVCETRSAGGGHRRLDLPPPGTTSDRT